MLGDKEVWKAIDAAFVEKGFMPNYPTGRSSVAKTAAKAVSPFIEQARAEGKDKAEFFNEQQCIAEVGDALEEAESNGRQKEREYIVKTLRDEISPFPSGVADYIESLPKEGEYVG